LREVKVLAKRNQDFRDVIMIDDFLKDNKRQEGNGSI
jgi:hypothetical protein